MTLTGANMKWLLLSALILLGCSSEMSLQVSSPNKASAIVGGVEVTAADPIAASTVQVYKVTASNQTITTCTGNVIANHVVLTAAHCVAGANEQNYIYFSSTIPQNIFQFFEDLKSNSDNLRMVETSAIADGWLVDGVRPEKDWHDIALLKISGDLPAGYHPIAMTQNLPANGSPVYIAGFGFTNGVQQVRSDSLRQAAVTLKDSAWSSSEILLDTTQGKASCHGDSGGPAYVVSSEGIQLLAIDSRSELKSDPKFECVGYTIYTRLAAYKSWIITQIQLLDKP